MMKGYIQVYTGDGKGKTTAALGLSLRAAGAGLSVCFAQFIKQGAYSEIRALEALGDRITVMQFGRGRFITGAPEPEEIAAARDGLEKIKAAMASGITTSLSWTRPTVRFRQDFFRWGRCWRSWRQNPTGWNL
jgi:cob(I)alamin adenosyltransferase